jgi:hypothetical protein
VGSPWLGTIAREHETGALPVPQTQPVADAAGPSCRSHALSTDGTRNLGAVARAPLGHQLVHSRLELVSFKASRILGRLERLKANDGLFGEFGENHPIAGGEAPAP